MIRFIPLAAGLALALGMALPALADGEGTFEQSVVASPDTGPPAAGAGRYGAMSYNDGTRVAMPQAPLPAMHAGNHVPSVQYNDGTRS